MQILIILAAVYFGINFLILISALCLDSKGARPFIGEMLFIGLPMLIYTAFTKRF